MLSNSKAATAPKTVTVDSLPEMRLNVVDANGVTLGIVTLNAKTFSTGSIGMTGSLKVTVGKVPFQIGVNAVVIGSKPKA